VQSSSQIITTNKPTSSFLQLPDQQCQSTEGKITNVLQTISFFYMPDVLAVTQQKH